MTSDIIPHKVITSTAIAALLLISGAGARLISQTDAIQPSASQLAPIAPTISLGEPIRTAKLESDDPEIKYENGFFFNFDHTGHILIRDKDGHLTGDFNLHLQKKDSLPMDIHDVAIFKDGSIVASWINKVSQGDGRRFSLVHYDPAGNFLEDIDLGQWRARYICIADDKSIWTLSGKEYYGHDIYSPDEGVLRNYKFGSGLVRAVVPRSNLPGQNSVYASIHSAIDCSGEKIHVLTGDGQWIEYTPGADFTITKIEPFSHSTYGSYWQLTGFAYLDDGHAYATIHSGPGDPFRRMLAELLPSKDGKTLQWVEVPPEKTLPVNTQPPDAATPPGTAPKEPIAVTVMLGADHEDGEQLVYRTSAGEAVLWSKPLFSSSVNQRDSTPPPAASAPGAPLITTSSR